MDPHKSNMHQQKHPWGCAVLCRAVLCRDVLCGAVLCSAVLYGAELQLQATPSLLMENIQHAFWAQRSAPYRSAREVRAHIPLPKKNNNGMEAKWHNNRSIAINMNLRILPPQGTILH